MSNYQFYYGAESFQDVYDHAIAVCNVLGNGKRGYAKAMLMETACAETQCGTFPDFTINNGFGITQHDHINVRDVIARTRDHNKLKVWDNFGFDIDRVKAPDLQDNPLLSFIFTRLNYILVPDIFPETVASRAEYWKTHHNTHKGKGTIEHYIQAVNTFQRRMGMH